VRYTDPDGRVAILIPLLPAVGSIILKGAAIAGAIIGGIVVGEAIKDGIENENQESSSVQQAEKSKQSIESNAQSVTPNLEPLPPSEEPNDKENNKTNQNKPTSQNQMQRQVEKGKAPKEIERVDKTHQKGGQNHVHFKNGTSLNQDGTVHDAHKGIPNPSNASKEWLRDNGWSCGE
jgi:hypothetical protein